MFHKFPFSRCVRVFLATFLLACVFQFVLIGIFGAYPKKFYQAMVQKERPYLPAQPIYRTNEELANIYFRKKESDLKLLDDEYKFMHKFYEAKSSNRTLIQNYNNWTLDKLPYFFGRKDGFYPDPHNSIFSRLAIWPEETYHDRIVNQMMYIPEHYDKQLLNEKKIFKKIYLASQKSKFNVKEIPDGQTKFINDNCPVNTCQIVRDESEAETADAIIFKEHVIELTHNRSADQVWIFYTLESPASISIEEHENLINWTATYRLDSDLVTPYAKFVKYQHDLQFSASIEDYSNKKSNKAAWFVSNCGSNRNTYAKELKKYFNVDIYGRCGDLRCPKYRSSNCFMKLRNEYKYYLSFENSICKDYITEKFYMNALTNNVLPIVLGPEHSDYNRQAPHFSFIHVDEFDGGVEELARFLNILNKNSTLYNTFFRWINTGEFVNTFFWCRLCALLHAPVQHKTYENLDTWWNKNKCDNRKTYKYMKPSNPS